jgi:hypothetical protein
MFPARPDCSVPEVAILLSFRLSSPLVGRM